MRSLCQASTYSLGSFCSEVSIFLLSSQGLLPPLGSLPLALLVMGTGGHLCENILSFSPCLCPERCSLELSPGLQAMCLLPERARCLQGYHTDAKTGTNGTSYRYGAQAWRA